MKAGLVAALCLAAAAAPLRAEDCAAFPFGVALCTAAAGLVGAAPRAEGPTTYFAGTYGAVIEVAPLSATANADPAFMRANLDAYLAEEKGLTDGLPEILRDRIDLGDRIAEQVVYRMEEDGTVIADSLILGDGFGVYVQTFDFGEDVTAAHRAFHDRVLGALRLPPVATPDVWTIQSRSQPPRPLAPEVPQ